MVIVLTGGIGSGKSTAAAILSSTYGYPVYDADSAVKRLYVSESGLLTDIEALAGRSFRNEDGSFSRNLLADWIFSSPEATCAVEELVFPVLMKDFEMWKRNQASDVVVFESATILEKPYFNGFGDVVLIVDAPLGQRIERVMCRDGVPREKVEERCRLQKLMNEVSAGRRIEGTYVCRNTGSADDLKSELKKIIENINIK